MNKKGLCTANNRLSQSNLIRRTVDGRPQAKSYWFNIFFHSQVKIGCNNNVRAVVYAIDMKNEVLALHTRVWFGLRKDNVDFLRKLNTGAI